MRSTRSADGGSIASSRHRAWQRDRAAKQSAFADIYAQLSPAIRGRLDELLGSAEGEGVTGSAPAALLTLRGNAGRPSLASMQEELASWT